MSSEPPRQRLPFEPKKSRKKADPGKSKPSVQPGSQNSPSTPVNSGQQQPQKPEVNKNSKSQRTTADQAIPKVVSQRMITRMALFSGIPLLLAVSIFIGSYFIVINELFVLPNTAVLLSSLGCFGLSVLGLSYGIFSASWDETDKGSLVGWSEFKLNLGRTWEAWKSARQTRKTSK